jgi:hypothetical protein
MRMSTKQIERDVQDRTVRDYRNAWGYPLGLNERRASVVAGVLCLVGAVAGLVLVWVLS